MVLEHAGSTSVPGWRQRTRSTSSGRPRFDRRGGVRPGPRGGRLQFAIREPEWFEHRLFRGVDLKVNLHAFSADCEEIGRMLAFRDWMRTHPEDRELYERAKRRRAELEHRQDYADAKTEVVREIVGRALAADSTDVHGTDGGDHRP